MCMNKYGIRKKNKENRKCVSNISMNPSSGSVPTEKPITPFLARKNINQDSMSKIYARFKLIKKITLNYGYKHDFLSQLRY